VAKKGPAATSIDDVISAAEVSRGTFYKYFDSPEALFDELAALLAHEMVLMAEPVVVLSNDPAERVAMGMRLVIHMAMVNRRVARFLIRLGWPTGGHMPELQEFVKRDLISGIRQQRFSELPLPLALNIVSMTVLGSLHSMLVPKASKNFAEEAVASAMRALGLSHAEASRLANMHLPEPRPLEGGLMAPNP
jgi:AcrR family transcriptional regulator